MGELKYLKILFNMSIEHSKSKVSMLPPPALIPMSALNPLCNAFQPWITYYNTTSNITVPAS